MYRTFVVFSAFCLLFVGSTLGQQPRRDGSKPSELRLGDPPQNHLSKTVRARHRRRRTRHGDYGPDSVPGNRRAA